jgi:hypothetical protein
MRLQPKPGAALGGPVLTPASLRPGSSGVLSRLQSGADSAAAAAAAPAAFSIEVHSSVASPQTSTAASVAAVVRTAAAAVPAVVVAVQMATQRAVSSPPGRRALMLLSLLLLGGLWALVANLPATR